MTRALALTLALAFTLALAGCVGPLGTLESKRGLSGVGQWQNTGIFIGNPQTGNGISIGAQSWTGALWATLDGDGKPIDPQDILACFDASAQVGASIMSTIVTGEAAARGCPE